MTNGTDLKLKRTAMNVSVADLAHAIGTHQSAVSRWETSVRVPQKAVARYLTGLATFGTIPTVTVTTEARDDQDAA